MAGDYIGVRLNSLFCVSEATGTFAAVLPFSVEAQKSLGFSPPFKQDLGVP